MKYFFCIIIFVFIITGLWAIFIEPNLLVIKKVYLRNPELAGIKLVFASDFHIKPYDTCRLRRIVKKINSLKPDIILLGGDYVNGHKKGFSLSAEKIAFELRNLKSAYGTVAVMGNHDGWQGKYEVINAFQKYGITVLENSNKDYGKFVVAGVEDMQTAEPDIEKALSGSKGRFVILLSHTPDIFPRVPQDVRLTLSGHTHGGQVVFPFLDPIAVPSEFGAKYAYGLKNENGKFLFTSKGLGTSILPVRFNCVPEIVLIEFTD